MRTYIFRISAALLILPALYIASVLAIGTMYDYAPVDTIPLTNLNIEKKQPIASDSLYTVGLWNIGYSGLGAQSNFFYDRGLSLRSEGYMVRSSQELCEQYWQGITKEIQEQAVDIWMFQEIDRSSKRSYYQDQYQALQDIFSGYAAFEATNYSVPYVPVPVLEPWQAYGKTKAGLATFFKYKTENDTRIQLPGNFDWPERVFLLDRCLSYHEMPLSSGKRLIVLNVHNSAYDDGSLKEQQMNLIKKIAIENYHRGNYVVVGGDWNQNPPGFDPTQIVDTQHNVLTQSLVRDTLFPKDWQWIYDPKIPTNRKCKDTYEKGTTKVTIIDYFLLSPNLIPIMTQTKDLNFAYSDHQPVYLTFKLGS